MTPAMYLGLTYLSCVMLWASGCALFLPFLILIHEILFCGNFCYFFQSHPLNDLSLSALYVVFHEDPAHT